MRIVYDGVYVGSPYCSEYENRTVLGGEIYNLLTREIGRAIKEPINEAISVFLRCSNGNLLVVIVIDLTAVKLAAVK